MTKQLIVTLLAFTALVAFASAHRPIIATTTTTLIEEELGSSVFSKQLQCSQKLQGQRFNQCQRYISNSRKQSANVCCVYVRSICVKQCMFNSETDQRLGLEDCCNELKTVEEECQCEAMQEVYRQAQQQPQWSQQSSQQDLQQIVQNLHNQCNLQVQQCRIPYAAMF